MAGGEHGLEERVAALTQEVAQLQQRVTDLEEIIVTGKLKVREKVRQTDGAAASTQEKILGMLGGASLLQRLSAICFIMVFALVLRTVTDNEIVERHIGSILGMLYAAGLMAWGYRAYRRQGSLASVFSVCGALLMFAVVVETHEHFEALPTPLAYLILSMVGLVMARLSHVHKTVIPVYVGTMGMAAAGVALDFPNPVFPYLVVLLLIANLIATFAHRVNNCIWLRWVTLGLTIFMMQIWGFRLGFVLTTNQGADLPFAISGFVPVVSLAAIGYIVMAYFGLTGRIGAKPASFDYALPAITVLWAFPALRYVTPSVGTEGITLGVSSVVFGLGMAWVARTLYLRDPGGEARGVTSLLVAAAILMTLALPMAAGNRIVGLAVVAVMALGLAQLSEKWKSGGVRLLSYLIQVHASFLLVLVLWRSEATAPSMIGAASCGTLALIAFCHYLWARKFPPFSESKIFSVYDKKDRMATLVLLAGLMSGFFTLRVGIHQLLVVWLPAEEIAAAFVAGQSTLINFSAIALAVYAFNNLNRELRNVAIFVMVVGGAKVFLIDLFSIKGVPIVASVFSFGVTAFLESIILARWNVRESSRGKKAETPPEGQGPGSRPPRRIGL